MNNIVKSVILATAVGATTLATLPAANARDWGDGWRRHGYHHHHHGSGDAAVAGIAGLAAGALIGGALASQPRYADPYYYDDGYAPAPRPVYRERYVYQGGLEPWTPAWYRYCSNRYRSFDGRTGTFVGYDGVRRFCTAG